MHPAGIVQPIKGYKKGYLETRTRKEFFVCENIYNPCRTNLLHCFFLSHFSISFEIKKTTLQSDAHVLLPALLWWWCASGNIIAGSDNLRSSFQQQHPKSHGYAIVLPQFIWPINSRVKTTLLRELLFALANTHTKKKTQWHTGDGRSAHFGLRTVSGDYEVWIVRLVAKVKKQHR